MKRVFLYIIIISLITLSLYLYRTIDNQNSVRVEESSSNVLAMELLAYSYATQDFISVTVDEVNDRIEKQDSFIIYIGRETCQYCRKIVPALHKTIIQENIELLYLDSTNSDIDLELAEFRKKYDVDTVPSICIFNSKGECRKVKIDFTLDNEQLNDSIRENLVLR